MLTWIAARKPKLFVSAPGQGFAIARRDRSRPVDPKGKTEAEARLRAFDWSATPLGPLDRWPRGLRAAVAEALGGGEARADRGANDAAEAARLSQERFALFMDNLPGLAWIKDGAGRYQYVNRAAEAAFGRPREALLGRTDSEIFPPATAEQFSANDEAARTSGGGIQTIETLRHPDGSLHHSLVSKFPFPGPGRGDRSVGGVAIDITEQRRAEEALQESEARFRTMSDMAPVMIWMSDETGRCQHLNRALRRYWNVSNEDLAAFDWSTTIHPEDAPAMAELLAKAMTTGGDLECAVRLRGADGRYRLFQTHARPRFSRDGQFLGMIGVNLDVTEQRRAEEALKESEGRYRAVVEDQSDMVCRFTAEGAILFANRAYAQSVGVPEEALQGVNLWAFVKEEDRENVRALLARMTPESPEVRIENRFNAADGVRWTLWANRALEFDAEGRWTTAQSTGVDITERKLQEEHIELLMREVNHRAKNLLSVVQAVARQTERDSPVDFASKLGQRLRGLAASQDLLVQGDWQGVDLGDLVRSQLLHVSEETGERLVLEGEPITVNAAAAQGIGMALHELATNAIKYGALSNDQGTVTVAWSRTRTEEGPALVLSWTERGGPPVTPPERRGFGATVIERMAGMAVSGRVELAFDPEGLRWRLEAAEENILGDGRGRRN
jgi:PAS domain S-box-containing protein